MQRSIIGILGRSRAGKDTMATILCELLTKKTPERTFEIQHIAKPLKDSITSMYSLTEDQMHGSLKDIVDMRYGHSPRELCMIWNNKLSHLHGSTFLIHRFFEKHDIDQSKPSSSLRSSHTSLIIPDVRFAHDCYEIRRRGGILVKIVRNRFPMQLDQENHIDQMGADISISNDSDMDALKQNIIDQVIPLVEAKMAWST